MERRYALVLAGGGAKGIYQIGVWKALRELDICYDVVVGSSIGAILPLKKFSNCRPMPV